MKKLIVLLLVLFSTTAYAVRYEKGFSLSVPTTDAQIFSKQIVLFGFDVYTDGPPIQVELYDTSGWAKYVFHGSSNPDGTGTNPVGATGTKISPKFFVPGTGISTSSQDYQAPIQTTKGGVYMDVTTSCTTCEITFYYDFE